MLKLFCQHCYEIYQVGISQGGHVAAKYCALYPNTVQKLVLYSSGMFDRSAETIYELRKQDDCSNFSDSTRQQQIFGVYDYMIKQKAYFDHFSKENKLPSTDKNTLINYYSIMNDYTFHEDVFFNYMLKVNVPILLLYGTLDVKSRDNDIIPFFFIQNNKNNLTVLPKLNCNHFFEQIQKNEVTNEEKKIYIGNEVFREVLSWFENKGVGYTITNLKR